MSVFTHSLATNNYGPNKFIVSSSAANGTHTTLTAALAAASSGDTIILRDGTYTENYTGKAGVLVTADSGASDEPNVTIIGKCSFATAGTFTISNIRLQTNSDFFLEVTGSSASVIQLKNCYLNAVNNTGINFTTSNTGASIACLNCYGNIATTGITAFVSSSTGVIQFINCIIANSGSSLTASTATAGIVVLYYTIFSSQITTSGTSQFLGNYSTISASVFNVAALTIGGSGVNQCVSCNIEGGTASAISIGSNLSLIDGCSVHSSNTNAITGAGTLNYTPITFTSSSATVNTSTQIKLAFGPGAFVPGGITFDNTNVLANFVAKTSFTPTLAFGGASVGITYTTRIGFYHRIGNLVTYAIRILTSSKGSSTGVATITGLPLTSSNDGNSYNASMVFSPGLVLAGATYYYANLPANSSTLTTAFGSAATGAVSAMTDTNFANVTQLEVAGFYFV